MDDLKTKKHYCVHGEIISTFLSECKVKAGQLSWKTKGSPDICPYQWIGSDCPKYIRRN